MRFGYKQIANKSFLAALTVIALAGTVQAGKGPVKVFILAGQSNMEGQGKIQIDPKKNEGKGTLEYLVNQYEENLANFIRDVRKELGVADLPFVIANSGFGGWNQKVSRRLKTMEAQAAVAGYEQFKGTVACVETRDFFRPPEVSPSKQGYHWNSNAETYFLIGDGMGRAMRRLCGQEQPPSGQIGELVLAEGLVLDLDADRGVKVVDGRVASWHNQAESKAREFVATRDAGHKKGTGHPVLKEGVLAIGGHNAVVFKRQELINSDEDAFDHLTTGSGYTWFAIMCVYPQVSGLKDVNSFFGNLKNGGNYEGFWAGLKDDNTLWMGSRNGITFGRWDRNNPQVLGPELEVNRYYVIAGRMGAGTGKVTIELFVDGTKPVASVPLQVNPNGNPSKMAIGQERDATNHPGHESFDGELARLLIWDRPLTDRQFEKTLSSLKNFYALSAR